MTKLPSRRKVKAMFRQGRFIADRLIVTRRLEAMVDPTKGASVFRDFTRQGVYRLPTSTIYLGLPPSPPIVLEIAERRFA